MDNQYSINNLPKFGVQYSFVEWLKSPAGEESFKISSATFGNSYDDFIRIYAGAAFANEKAAADARYDVYSRITGKIWGIDDD